MVDCLQPPQIDDFLQGRLSEAQADAIAAHLEQCAACQLLLEQACRAPELEPYRHLADNAGEPSFLLPPPDVERLRLRMGATGNAATSSADRNSLIVITGERSSATDATELYPRSDEQGKTALAPPDGDAPLPLPFAKLGNYDILSRIGKGGMGEVYEAFHPKLRRRVAIKVLSPKRFRDPDAVQRFYREMESIGRLNHPHIVQAHDAGEASDTLYLVMELVDGCDAGLLGQTKGKLTVADACEIARQTALGLQHAHEHHLVHRDVKPSNILIAGGVAKLADLGLAKFQRGAASPLTGSGLIVGTPDYMSPEQAEGAREIDIRSDVYSLGCTLYCLLSGRPPFGTPRYDSNLKKLLAHSQEPIPPLGAQRPDLPAGLWQVLLRMLAKEPGTRFATPREAALALEPYAAGHRLADLTADIRISRSTKPGSTGSASSAALSNVATLRVQSPGRLHAPFQTVRELRQRAVIAALLVILAASAGYAWWNASQDRAARARASAAAPVAPAAAVEPCGADEGAPPAVGAVDPHRAARPAPGAAAPFRGPAPKPTYREQWLNAMQREPVEHWPGQAGRGTWTLDDGLQALLISAEGPKFVCLGELADDDETIGIDIDSRTVAGRFGLFFECHDKELQDRRLVAMQLVALHRFEPPDQPAQLMLRRCQAVLAADHTIQTGVEHAAHRPPETHARLEVDIRQRNIVAVRWRGEDCPELVAETVVGRFEAVSGFWGVFCDDATAWFSQPQQTMLR